MRNFFDQSGYLKVTLIERQSDVAPSHTDFAVEVPPNMVCVGGGARAIEFPGAYLTASYPRNDLRAWVVSTKDHIHPAPHSVTAFALGLEVTEGPASGSALREYVRIYSDAAGALPHPSATVSTASPRELLLGGGFRVLWEPGKGNLATGSLPALDGWGWTANSKDHIEPSPAVIQVYVITIERMLPLDKVVHLEIHRGIYVSTGGMTSHPWATAFPDTGYVLCGGGAQVNQGEGAGNLLWKLQPLVDETWTPNPLGFTAASKDLDIPAPATIQAYAVGCLAQRVF